MSAKRDLIASVKVKIAWHENMWGVVRDSALFTIRKEGGGKEPSSDWKRRMLMAEHSPIRDAHIIINVYNLPTFVANHFVRHHEGFVPFMASSREDRTTYDEGKVPDRETPTNLRFDGNLQSFINISRKRYCMCASAETRAIWTLIMEAIKEIEPELYEVCHRECVYRGWCPEYKSCGYHLTSSYKEERDAYWSGINGYPVIGDN